MKILLLGFGLLITAIAIDTLRMICPLQNRILQSPSKNKYQYQGDKKAVIKSISDTLLLSRVADKVDLITIGENGK